MKAFNPQALIRLVIFLPLLIVVMAMASGLHYRDNGPIAAYPETRVEPEIARLTL